MKFKKILNKTALILTAVGATNWLLAELLNFELVGKLSTSLNTNLSWVYIVIGLAGLYVLIRALQGKAKVE